MSDYLWDKTGEPEEDVERLEQMLGALRYEPRPFELPEDFGARAPARNSFRTPQRPLRWQRLALAASLLLTLLAGAWLITKLNQREVSHEMAGGSNSTPVTPAPPTVEHAPQSVAPHEATANNNVKDQPAPASQETAGFTSVNYHRPRRVFHRDGANRQRHAPHAVAEPTREQIAAAEQLLLALRITSAKLNYAQREMQEASARKPETR